MSDLLWRTGRALIPDHQRTPLVMKSPLLVFLPLLSLHACSPVAGKPKLDPISVERKMLNLQKNFNIIDSSKNHSLSPAEVKQGLIRSGSTNVSDERVQKLVHFYDFNRDGKIDLREAQSGAVSGPQELIKELE